MTLTLKDLSAVEKQNWLQHAIAPRPIGLISSISRDGKPNLAPFSFFNLFSSEPPIVIFSPARRVRDNTIKHTLVNAEETGEVVVNIVTFDMVQQVSLTSCEYPHGEDEFIKAGFTKERATMIKPAMVKESPIKLECKVIEIKPLGNNGGAGNLIIAEVLCMHVEERILNENKTMIDQTLVHHVARLGGKWYSKVSRDNMFEVEKPNIKLGIGFDQLPDEVKSSTVFTKNHLAQLANVSVMPEFKKKNEQPYISEKNTNSLHFEVCKSVVKLLDVNKVDEAWELLLVDLINK